MTEREERLLAYWHNKMNLEYPLEADFLKDAKAFCEMLGKSCLVVREAAATKNGVADLLLCYNGRFIACELKRIGGVPSPQQLKFIDKTIKAGGLGAVCRNLADIWKLIERTAPES
jgi:hypothetical protein